MLLFQDKIANLRIASVQATQQIGQVTGRIINPRNLSIPALYVRSRLAPDEQVLHTSDVRDINNSGLLIDHDNQLMDTDDLVRLKEIIAMNFELIGKPVETEDGDKLGKVINFVFDSTTWLIMKIHVKQSIVRNMGTSELIIHRRQVVKVSDARIVVKSTAAKGKAGFSWKKMLLGSQKPAFEPETSQTAERS